MSTIADLLVKISADISDLKGELGNATSAIDGFAGNAARAAGGVSGALQRMAEFAGGQLLVQGLQSIASGFTNLGREALQSVAYAERMDMAFTSLLAKEIANASGIEKTIMVQQQQAALTEGELANLDKLKNSIQDETLKRNLLGAQMQEQQQRIIDLTARYGASGLATITATAQLAEMQDQYNDLGASMDKNAAKVAALEARNGGLVTVAKTVREGQISVKDAMGQASGAAQELARWSQQLAVQSPFQRQDVDNALRLAMAYGFTSEEAKRLTAATIDFSAGSGASAESMGRITLALGQIRARGKLAGQEMMQLTEAGVSVREILAQAFGVSTAQLEKMIEGGLVPADKAIEAITASLEKDFGGAAKAQAGTFSGLLSSLSDLKQVGLREFFEGTFTALKPYIQQFVDTLSSPAFMASINQIGVTMGANVTMLIQWLTMALPPMQAFGQSILGWATTAIPPVLTAIQAFIGQVQAFMTPIMAAISPFVKWQDVLGALAITLGGVLITGLIGFVSGIAPVVAAVVGLVAAVALARNAWESDWGGIRTALTAFWTTTAAPILGQLMTWLQVNVPVALQFLTNAWNNTLLPALRAVWGFLSTSIIPLWQALAGVEMALLQKALEALAGIWQNVLLPALQSVWQFITKNVTPMFDGLGAAIDPITGKISDLIGWVDSLKNSLSGLKLPDWMTPGSPTPLELGLVGINDAMKQVTQSAGAVRIPPGGGSSNTFNIAVRGGSSQAATLAAIEAGVDRALARSGQRGMSTNELAWALARAMQQQRAGRGELS